MVWKRCSSVLSTSSLSLSQVTSKRIRPTDWLIYLNPIFMFTDCNERLHSRMNYAFFYQLLINKSSAASSTRKEKNVEHSVWINHRLQAHTSGGRFYLEAKSWYHNLPACSKVKAKLFSKPKQLSCKIVFIHISFFCFSRCNITSTLDECNLGLQPIISWLLAIKLLNYELQ